MMIVLIQPETLSTPIFFNAIRLLDQKSQVAQRFIEKSKLVNTPIIGTVAILA